MQNFTFLFEQTQIDPTSPDALGHLPLKPESVHVWDAEGDLAGYIADLLGLPMRILRIINAKVSAADMAEALDTINALPPEYRATGRPISQFDCQIAAIARAHEAAVATPNTGDYAGCRIEVIDPWKAR
jgi:hypothetical protein